MDLLDAVTAQMQSLPFLDLKRTLRWIWGEIGTAGVRATEIRTILMTTATLKISVKKREMKGEMANRGCAWTGRMMRENEKKIETEVKDMVVVAYVSQICLQRHPVKEKRRRRGL